MHLFIGDPERTEPLIRIASLWSIILVIDFCTVSALPFSEESPLKEAGCPASFHVQVSRR
ncbi:hypothetical protein PO124_07240 [Bacillus licheniformis]|nr:hypothetical protein [Bacillus licheniformis]